MPRKLKESQEWDEEESNKKSKTEASSVDFDKLENEVIRAVQHFNDPSGIIYTSFSRLTIRLHIQDHRKSSRVTSNPFTPFL